MPTSLVRSLVLAQAVLAASASAAGCASPQAAGVKGEVCYRMADCVEGLVCVQNVCTDRLDDIVGEPPAGAPMDAAAPPADGAPPPRDASSPDGQGAPDGSSPPLTPEAGFPSPEAAAPVGSSADAAPG